MFLDFFFASFCFCLICIFHLKFNIFRHLWVKADCCLRQQSVIWTALSHSKGLFEVAISYLDSAESQLRAVWGSFQSFGQRWVTCDSKLRVFWGSHQLFGQCWVTGEGCFRQQSVIWTVRSHRWGFYEVAISYLDSAESQLRVIWGSSQLFGQRWGLSEAAVSHLDSAESKMRAFWGSSQSFGQRCLSHSCGLFEAGWFNLE